MAAEWLRADQVAAIAARWQGPHDAHSPYWPQITDVAQLLAQDGRWRALVGRWAEAKRALMAVLAVESNDNAPIVNLGVMAVADAEDALMAAFHEAQAALDGGA